MIICNTLNGAVTEYDWPAFQSITATHAGSASGLFAFGGDTDVGEPIVAEIRLPATLRGNSFKKHILGVFLSMRGTGSARFSVYGPGADRWDYPFLLVSSGQTRAQPGRGIRQNYLGFGVSNPAGQAFTIDRIEVVEAPSKTRRSNHG